MRDELRDAFESRQDQLRGRDQLRVEHKARVGRGTHVELWSSLLVGGIAVSLIITRAMPGTSASFFITLITLKHRSNQNAPLALKVPFK